MVVLSCMILCGAVNYKTHTILDILERSETLAQITNQFRKFVSPGFADMTLVDD